MRRQDRFAILCPQVSSGHDTKSVQTVKAKSSRRERPNPNRMHRLNERGPPATLFSVQDSSQCPSRNLEVLYAEVCKSELFHLSTNILPHHSHFEAERVGFELGASDCGTCNG